jgi:hypothetical protein
MNLLAFMAFRLKPKLEFDLPYIPSPSPPPTAFPSVTNQHVFLESVLVNNSFLSTEQHKPIIYCAFYSLYASHIISI